MFECTWPGDSARGLPGVLGSPTDPLCPRHTSNNPNRTVLPQWGAGRGWTLRSIDPGPTKKNHWQLWRNGHESLIHWIMPHDARISRDSLCHGKCMEGVGKTWEVARESADGDYCHFDYLTVEDEDDNDVDDDDDDWGLACTFPTEIFPVFLWNGDASDSSTMLNLGGWMEYDEQNDHWSEYQKTNTLFSALSTTLGFGGLILIQKKYCS